QRPDLRSLGLRLCGRNLSLGRGVVDVLAIPEKGLRDFNFRGPRVALSVLCDIARVHRLREVERDPSGGAIRMAHRRAMNRSARLEERLSKSGLALARDRIRVVDRLL